MKISLKELRNIVNDLLKESLNDNNLILYHGTNLKIAPNLRIGSYTTTEFDIAVSYGLDKTNSKYCFVHQYVVQDPFELIKIGPYPSELKIIPRYNHEMGHDAFVNNVILYPSTNSWYIYKVDYVTDLKFGNIFFEKDKL